jgi:predicted nucleic acid-binding protein
MRAFFYDTWAFVALAHRRDAGHAVAVALDVALERSGYVAVTTDHVLSKTLTLLNRAAGVQTTLAFLDGFLARVAGGDIQQVDVTAERRDRAVSLFRKLAPGEQRLSFTDVTSFSVMHEFGIQLAFTADAHFHCAGRGVAPMIEARRGRFRATLP